MPLNQLAGLSVPEPTLIVAQPFDPSLLGAIEKAIRTANLGLNPANDGKVIRIPIPSLTEERRKELSRLVHKSEEGRNAVRQVRRDANDRLKKLLKDHKISEDDERRGLDDVQKITDQHVTMIDEIQKKKDQELLGERYAPSMPFFPTSNAPCRAGRALDPRGRHHLCSCGAPLLARYDLEQARAWSRDTLPGRPPTMWRYRELMPLFDGEEPVTLGEGWTPLIHATRLGRDLGLTRLFIKDESLNPTNSFKARGLSAAVTRAKYLGARVLSVPTAGNAGNAMAAYAARRRASRPRSSCRAT